MLVTRVSMLSGKRRTTDLDITEAQWAAWNQPKDKRPLVQDCFPRLSADDREFILTGATPDEWDRAFPPDEEAPSAGLE